MTTYMEKCLIFSNLLFFQRTLVEKKMDPILHVGCEVMYKIYRRGTFFENVKECPSLFFHYNPENTEPWKKEHVEAKKCDQTLIDEEKRCYGPKKLISRL